MWNYDKVKYTSSFKHMRHIKCAQSTDHGVMNLGHMQNSSRDKDHNSVSNKPGTTFILFEKRDRIQQPCLLIPKHLGPYMMFQVHIVTQSLFSMKLDSLGLTSCSIVPIVWAFRMSHGSLKLNQL
ncbi:hypothetical protein M8J77_015398 [Diaphorina citri]|nr:hypothetical protein M8J77_015398 [Diaphorina citri]